MLKANKKDVAIELKKELARREYESYYVLAFDGEFEILPHVKFICDKLQKIIDGEEKFYIFTLPPQHGKSTAITETFPSYYYLKNPDKSAMIVAYGEDLYKKFGRANKRKIEKLGVPLFNKAIARDVQSVSEVGIKDAKGTMQFVSVQGGATGRPADLLVIDDPIKNRKEAESKTYRDNVWNEWTSSLLTRFHPGGSIIIIMTRWHADDLVGRLLKQNAYDWEVFNLPAICDSENDPLGREIGESLAPAMGYDEDWAAKRKVASGSRDWNAMYQGKPVAESGNVFNKKWFKFYVSKSEKRDSMIEEVALLPKYFDRVTQSWDCTFKNTASSDYVSGTVWGERKGKHYLLHRVHKQMNFIETIEAMNHTLEKFPETKGILIEDKANGTAIITVLKNKVSGIIPVTPKESKVARAYAATPFFEAGDIFIPHPDEADWVDGYVDEMLSFPNGEHDDDVDSTTQYINNIKRSKNSIIERAKEAGII